MEFVGEYAPYDMYALENIARAVELFPHMSAMMKVAQEPRTYIAARPVQPQIRVSVCAARTLNVIGPSRVTLSLR